MRDLLLLAIVTASLPVIVFRPYFGLLVYAWLAYLRPQNMAWGVFGDLPLSQWVAVALVLGMVLALGRERWLVVNLQTVLLMLLAGWISITVTTAVLPDVSGTLYGYYWKAILIAILSTGLVKDRQRFRLLLLLIAFCIGLLGAKRGLAGLLHGGARYYDGPGGFMSDNNSFAMALNMMLPLLAGVVLVEKRKALRIAAGVVAALCLMTILFTFSRGGLLTLGFVLLALVWRSRHRLAMSAAIALVVVGTLFFTSDAFQDAYLHRASTISSYEEDRSALGRLNAWETSWRVFLDYPVFGVGPDNLQVVYRTYSPTPERFRVSHNAYLQILAECGLPALLLFVASLAAAYWSLGRLRRKTALPWAETYARMLQISIAAYAISSLFLNTAYAELIYQLLGMSVSLEVIARAAAEEPAEAAPAAPDEPWWRRPLAAAPALARRS